MPREMPRMIAPLVERVGGQRRAMIIAAGVGAALLILLLANIANRPTWVPAVSGVALENTSVLTERLRTEKIQYRLESGGTQIMVPASDLARARVALARDGMPTSGRPGLELFDQPSWGMTDFTQRVNYRRALEGELERTISKMRGVEVAQVHLAIRETAGFRRGGDRPAEASVVLRLKSGATPGADVVQGIAHLVASSVDGLESEKVTVLDDSGRLLSMPDEPGSLAGLTSRQLAIQRDVEAHLARRTEELLAQVVGPGNARVQVSATINFDRVERTTQSVDGERQALITEQKAEIIPGPEGGAGSSNIANSYEPSRSVETVSGAIGGVQRLTVAVLVNERQPEVAAVGGDGAAGTVATPRTDGEIAQITELVRAAVGADASRGDQVSVVSVPFAPPMPMEDVAPTIWDRVEQVQKPATTAFALLLAAVIALVAIRALRPRAESAPTGESATSGVVLADAAAADASAGAAASAMDATSDEDGDEDEAADERLTEGQPAFALPASPVQQLRGQAIETVEQNPDVALRLVRSWLREG